MGALYQGEEEAREALPCMQLGGIQSHLSLSSGPGLVVSGITYPLLSLGSWSGGPGMMMPGATMVESEPGQGR